MNHLCYKTIFCERLGTLVAVGEHASSHAKGRGAGAAKGAAPACTGGRFMGLLAMGFASVSLVWSQTLPQGAQVTQGAVSFSQSANQMAITQTTAKAVVNWQSFDIGQNAKVNITQPGSQSVLLNRVLSDNPTRILGQLQANGQVVLVNPKGIVVGSDGSVSASAFTASTLNISDADFLAGRERYTRDGSTGQVINKGRIEVAPGGHVALLGASVSNEGQIIAPSGGVALGAAETVTVPMGRTGKIKLELTPASINAAVANQSGGLIVAESGQVYLQAAALGQAVASALNAGRIDTSGEQAGAVHVLADGGRIKVNGSIQANSSGHDKTGQLRKGGDIVIGRDLETGVLAADADVSGARLESRRGFVETSGHQLHVDRTNVNAATWLLDPDNIDITDGTARTGYSKISASTLASTLNSAEGISVVISTTAANRQNQPAFDGSVVAGDGNILVSSNIIKSGSNNASLTLLADNGISVGYSGIIGYQANGNPIYESLARPKLGKAGTDNTSTGKLDINLTAKGLVGGKPASGTGAMDDTERARSAGVLINGAQINTNGGNISIQGTTYSSFTANLNAHATNAIGMGVQIHDTVSMTGGDISISGTAENQLNNVSYGVNFQRYSGPATLSATGNISILGTVKGYGSGSGFTTQSSGWGAQAPMISAGGKFTLRGNNRAALNNGRAAIQSGSGMQVRAVGDVVVQAETNNTAANAMNFTSDPATVWGLGGALAGNVSFRSIDANGQASGNVLIQSNGGSIQFSNQVKPDLTSGSLTALTDITGKNVSIDNTGAGMATGEGSLVGSGGTTGDTVGSGSIDTSTGAIVAGAGTSRSNYHAINISDGRKITASENLNILGVSTNNKAGIFVKNLVNSGTLISNAVLTGKNIQAKGTSNGVNGITLDAGISVITTGSIGDSLITATAGSSAGNGEGALRINAGVKLRAAPGSTLTLDGQATQSGTSYHLGTRGIRVDGGMSADGEITLKGSSKSSDGFLAVNGLITAANNTQLNIVGTTAGNGGASTGVSVGNAAGVVLNNGASLNITGEAANTGTPTSPETAVSIGGEGITKATGSTTAGDVTITGIAKSAGNSNGVNVSANVGTGTGNIEITAQTRGNSSGHAVNLAADLSTTGNVLVHSVGGHIAQSASKTISGDNITLDNTGAGLNSFFADSSGGLNLAAGQAMGGSVNANNGEVSPGAGVRTTSSNSAGVSVAGNLKATGDIHVQGHASANTPGGVSLASTGKLSSTGPAASIQIAANHNLINNASIEVTASNGAGAQIELSSSLGGISGAGWIGTGTHSYADVTFSQASTSTYSGDIHSSTFTKDGAGRLVMTGQLLTNSSNRIEQGTLQIGAGSTAGSMTGNATIAEGASLEFNRSDTITVTGTLSGAGSLVQAGTGTTVLTGDNTYGGTTSISSGTLQVGNGGSTGTLGAGAVSLSNNAHLFYSRSVDTSIANHISGTGSVSASITGAGSDLNVTQPISLTNGTVNLWSDGHLNVKERIGTTNASTSAVVLVAGQPAPAGRAEGGDIVLSDNAAISVGAGGRATLFTGSLAGSAGLDVISGNNRYNSDEVTSNYTSPLGTGVYAIYREQPQITVQVNDASKTYDGLAFSGGSLNSTLTSGHLHKADTFEAVTANAVFGGSAQGAKNASPAPYDITASDNAGPSALGYGITYATGKLTVSKADLTVTANDDARFVGLTDTTHYAGASFKGWVNGETPAVLSGDLAITRTNAATESAGIYKGVLLPSGLSSDNYNIAYVPGSYTIVPANQLLIRTRDTQVTYGTTPVYETTAQYLDGSNNAIITLTRTGDHNQYTFKDGLGTTVTTTLKPYTDTAPAQVSSSGNTVVGSYSVKDSQPGVTGDKNFVGAPVFVGNLTVEPKSITPSATGVHKVYDGTTAMNNLVLGTTDQISGDILNLSGTGAFTSKNAGTGLHYTVTHMALSGADAGNYRLLEGNTQMEGRDGVITPAMLKLTTRNVIKTYDGTTAASGTAMATQGTQLFDGDTTSGGTFVFTNKNAGTDNKVVTVSGVTINDGNQGKNYTVEYVDNTSSTIRKANLTVTASQVEKIYDGTTTAEGNASVGILAGQAAGEIVSSVGSQSFLNKNAGTNKYVRASGVTIKDSANIDVTGNYDIHYVDNTTSTIHKANLQVSLADQTKVYDGTTHASLAAGAITATGVTVGGITETATVTQKAGTYNSKNVATAHTVTAALSSSDFTSGTADLNNYNLPTSVSNSNSHITQATLNVTLANQTKVYDGTTNATLAAGAITATGVTVGGITEMATVTQTEGLYNSKNVASANTVTATLDAAHFSSGTADLSNYKLPTFVSNTASTITKAALTLTANSDTSKVYNGTEQRVDGFTITSGQLQGTDSIEVDLANITAGAKATNAGTYASTVNDAAYTHGNYAITKINGTLFIDQKEVSLAAAKTYDGHKLLSGSQLRITTGVGSETLGYSFASIHSKNVADNRTNYVDAVTLVNGTHGGLASNYKLPALTKAVDGINTATLTPKVLTAGISDVTTTYGTPKAPGAVNLIGKVNGDDVQASGSATLVDAEFSTSGNLKAGSYAQTATAALSGKDASNYSFAGFTTNGKNYVVNRKTITLNGITAADKTYDGNTQASVSDAGASFNGMVTGDKLTVSASGTFTDKHAGKDKTVTLSNTLGGEDLDNYTVLGQSNTKADITPKDLYVSGLTAASKVYDGNTKARVVVDSAIFDGLVQDDVVSISATGNFDNRHAGQNKPVSISSIFGGLDVGNYKISSQTQTTADITPAPLQVKAQAVRKTYDGTSIAPGTGVVMGPLAGAAAGDVVDSSGSLMFADKNAGTGKTVSVKDVRLIDGQKNDVTGNYSIEYIHSTDGVIERANASISAPATTVIYNGQTQKQANAAYSGIVAGDDVQAHGLASGRNVGSYMSALQAFGADVGNYNITFNNAALNIGKKAASLSSLDQRVVYNGQTQSLNGTQDTGFVAGDDLTFGGLPSGRDVGRYTAALTVSGADAANYDISVGNGSLTITPKDALVTARDQRVTYNGQTQTQSAAEQQGFMAGDEILISGLASGRNAGSYLSNLSISGAHAKNYAVRYQQGTLTIQKAPLQFVGTTASDKLADGTTIAQVQAGRITGLIGNESLNITSVTGQFDNPLAGTNKPVQVVYGLSNGLGGGLVSNYEWSPTVVTANITAPANSNWNLTDARTPKNTYSRLYFQGFGGLGGVGAATGQASYIVRQKNQQACSPKTLEGCLCERPAESVMEICYPAEESQQARR